MTAIDIDVFTKNFMTISDRLTISELQILYLFITDPSVIKLSQQQIAGRINKNRRTVVLSLKKLKQLGYLSDINITKNQNIRKSSQRKKKGIISSAYNSLINKYITYEEKDVLSQIFNKYPDEGKRIIWDIRYSLPDNIDAIAKKFNIEEELRVIRLSNKHLEDYEKQNPKAFSDINSIIAKCISNFNNKGKKAALEKVRILVLLYPASIEKFMIDNKANLIDNLEENLNEMIKEIYQVGHIYQYP